MHAPAVQAILVDILKAKILPTKKLL